MGERLRNKSSAGKAFRRDGLFPRHADIRAQADFDRHFVRFDFPSVAAGLDEMDRMRQVSVLQFIDFYEAKLTLFATRISRALSTSRLVATRTP